MAKDQSRQQLSAGSSSYKIRPMMKLRQFVTQLIGGYEAAKSRIGEGVDATKGRIGLGANDNKDQASAGKKEIDQLKQDTLNTESFSKSTSPENKSDPGIITTLLDNFR